MKVGGLDWQVLGQVAKSGVPLLPWAVFRPMIELQILLLLRDLYEEEMPVRRTEEEFTKQMRELVKLLRRFDTDAPFTIQRICELLVDPLPRGVHTVQQAMDSFRSLLQVTSTVPVGNLNQVAWLEQEYLRFAPPACAAATTADAEEGGLTRTGTLDI
ncbi:hypothetical protein BASA81_009820 [Batrachochytrium salamandrivorans]|nr:hypothetical protein BASA81_009820 [Batrachochytrium salamandrivorans]